MGFRTINRLAYGFLFLSFLCVIFFAWPGSEPQIPQVSDTQIVFRGYPSDFQIKAKASLSDGNAPEIPLGKAYEPLLKENIRDLGSSFTLTYQRDGFHSITEEFKDPKKLLSSTKYPSKDLITLKPQSGLSAFFYKLQSEWPWLVGAFLSLLAFCVLYFKQQAVNKFSEGLYKVGAKAGMDKFIGTTVKDYTITGHLGEGAWGSVYQALPTSKIGSERTGKSKVAVKFYALFGFLDNPENRERFLTEGYALKDLNHPNIVRFIEAGETEDEEQENRRPYLILEFISGEGLDMKTFAVKKETIKEDGIEVSFDKHHFFKILPKQILTWVGPIVDALEYAHSKGVIHRDLKPENVKIDEDGRPVLLDFGLSKLSKSTYTKSGTTMGTPLYAPPELAINAAKAVPQSDQFSLGVMIYHMLSGEPPFGYTEGEVWKNLIIELRQPAPIESYDDNVNSVLQKMMAFEIDHRYSSVREAYEELEKALRPWL